MLSESFEAAIRTGAPGLSGRDTPSTATAPRVIAMVRTFLPLSISKRITRSPAPGVIEHSTERPPFNLIRIGTPSSPVKPRARESVDVPDETVYWSVRMARA